MNQPSQHLGEPEKTWTHGTEKKTSLPAALHQLLRGRYLWATLLGLVGGLGGALAAFLFAQPIYRSGGLVRIEPLVPRILYPTEDANIVPIFDSFVESQMSILSSPDVIQSAMASPQWRKAMLHRSMPDPSNASLAAQLQITSVDSGVPLGQFLKNLTIEHTPRSQIISVYYSDVDPVVAQAGVQSLLDSYLKRYADQSSRKDAQRLDVLRQRRADLAAQVDSLNRQITATSAPYGPEGFDQVYLSKLQEVNHLEAALREAQQTGGLLARLQGLKQLREEAKTEAAELGRKKNDLDHYRNDLVLARQDLDDVKKRIEELEIEARGQGRIRVVSSGELPASAFKDRRPQMTIAGLVGGSSIGVGLILLLGLLDSRIRSVSDLCELPGAATTLGVLPQLPKRLAHPTKARTGAHCVHQLRSLLQIWTGPERPPVFAITSANAADGKTSLALALGASYAAGGARTLLIDCDLIGGGLSRRTGKGVRPTISDVLITEALVTQEQLEKALLLVDGESSRLPQALLDLNYLRKEDLDLALALQEQRTVGLLDVAAGAELMNCVIPSPIQGLWVLPIGQGDGPDASRLSLPTLRKIIAAARTHFDCVLIDTGPVPGSVEASLAVAEADAALLVIPWGLRRHLAEQAAAHITGLGAPMAIVFNRATRAELKISGADSRMSQPQWIEPGQRESHRQNRKFIRGLLKRAELLGPLPSAVAACSRSLHGRSLLDP